MHPLFVVVVGTAIAVAIAIAVAAAAADASAVSVTATESAKQDLRQYQYSDCLPEGDGANSEHSRK